MDRPITPDGWQKSTRSGGANTECVEVKAIEK